MLYAIAGSGEAPTNEINEILSDLRSKATADDVDFWLLLEARDKPSRTDKAILAWAIKTETYFETYTSTDAVYEGASDAHHSDDPLADMLARILESQPDEDGWVLALLPPDDAPDDEPLMALIEAANAADVEVRQLNGAMESLSLTDTPVEEAEEEPEPSAPAKKAATKKAAAKAAAAPAKKAAKKAASPAAARSGVADDEPEEAEAASVYSEAELRRLGVPELTGIARGQGVDTRSLGKRDLIAAILGSTRLAEAEEAEAAATALASTTTNNDDVVIIVIPRSKLTALLG